MRRALSTALAQLTGDRSDGAGILSQLAAPAREAVAAEGGPFGVRVNAVCPGLIDTEMVRATIAPDDIRRYEAAFPIHRLGTPDEVAELVLFLCSDRSAYITGTELLVDGGVTMRVISTLPRPQAVDTVGTGDS